MPKGKAKIVPEVPVTGDVADLLAFWKQLVSGRIVVRDDGGKQQEIIVPLEVRLRASDLLAKHLMPKGGRLVEEVEDDVTATPEVLQLATALETKAAEPLLEQAFMAIRAQKARK